MQVVIFLIQFPSFEFHSMKMLPIGDRCRHVQAACLALLLMMPAVGNAFQERATHPKSGSQETEQKRSGTWNTSTYVCPSNPGIPKAVIRETKNLGGSPLVAIWDDGTIAWRDETRKEQDMYFVSNISIREINETLQTINRHTARIYPNHSQAVGTRNCPMDDTGIGFVLLLSFCKLGQA